MRIGLLFLFGLALRLLFWHATPDRDLPFGACYQGDAPYWQQLAQAAASPGAPVPVDVQIALRPPGTRWLVAWLWNGDPATAAPIRVVFAALGALLAPLLYLAVRTWFGERRAAAAGWCCAASTGLLQLGSGLHSETPYLVLLLGTMLLWPTLRQAPGRAALPWALLFGALHGLAALFRAEHLLLVLGLLVLLALPRPRRLLAAVAAAFACGVVLLPWHLHARSRLDAFQTPPPLPERTALPWNEAARAGLRALPGSLQLPALHFVTDTVRHRGGREVQAADLAILTEAYGPLPGPLPPPLIASYGPLNFLLANHPAGDGAFRTAGLDEPPPLLGGEARYPPGLRAVLPRDGQLSLGYPPHLRALVDGYALGWQHLLADPARTAALLARKAAFYWQGAAMGLGGHGLPLGLSGTRRPVDLTVAEGALAAAFRVVMLGLVLLGAFRLRGQPAAWPWLWFLLAQFLVALLFFGYARQGALGTPTVALLLTAAVAPRWQSLPAPVRRAGPGRVLVAAGVVLLAIELGRWAGAPQPRLDGVPFPPASAATPLDRYVECRVTFTNDR